MALYTAKGAKNAKLRHILITYSCAEDRGGAGEDGEVCGDVS